MSEIETISPLQRTFDDAYRAFVEADRVFQGELDRRFSPSLRAQARYTPAWDDDGIRWARQAFIDASKQWQEALRNLRSCDA